MNAPEFVALIAFIRIIVPFGLVLLLGELTKQHNSKHHHSL